MKLASLRTTPPDGQLTVVSRDEAHFVIAGAVASSLQDALDRWETVAPQLRRIYEELDTAHMPGRRDFQPELFTAPLPRAWQWLDASAFPMHGELMQRAFNLPPIDATRPLMYQGMSHRFFGAMDDVPFVAETDGIDFEGELGVVTGAIPVGTSASEGLDSIRLLVLINDWSLRVIAPEEMKTGFGWVQAKPACSMAPIAVTPDEMGSAWRDGRLEARIRVEVNGKLFGDVPSSEMAHGFHELIAHAARTRDLCAGTIIGSGTLSSSDYRTTGSCCISERRAIEMIGEGRPSTSFLQFGDRVCIRATVGSDCRPAFGEINQRAVSAFQPPN